MQREIPAHFVEFTGIAFIGFYGMISLVSNLNLGVRHLIPIYPFIFLLLSGLLVRIVKRPNIDYKTAVLGGLLLWQVISVTTLHPHFLAYFNEVTGGPENGYRYVVDSNLDWGQDIKRLARWVEEKNLQHIYIDYYFHKRIAEHYLHDRYRPWQGTRNDTEVLSGSYLAVSASYLQGGRAKPGFEFTGASQYYRWLDSYQVHTTIGYSIFIYQID